MNTRTHIIYINIRTRSSISTSSARSTHIIDYNISHTSHHTHHTHTAEFFKRLDTLTARQVVFVFHLYIYS